MRFLFAITVFFISMLLELTFVPRVLGMTLPLSFWVSSVFFAEFKPREVLVISFASGLIETAFLPAFNGLFLLLFLAVALIVLFVRRILDGEGIIYELAAIAGGVFSFWLLRPVFAMMLGASGAINALAPENFAAAFPFREFLFDLLFIALAGLFIYVHERRRYVKGTAYV